MLPPGGQGGTTPPRNRSQPPLRPGQPRRRHQQRLPPPEAMRPPKGQGGPSTDQVAAAFLQRPMLTAPNGCIFFLLAPLTRAAIMPKLTPPDHASVGLLNRPQPRYRQVIVALDREARPA